MSAKKITAGRARMEAAYLLGCLRTLGILTRIGVSKVNNEYIMRVLLIEDIGLPETLNGVPLKVEIVDEIKSGKTCCDDVFK